MGERKVLNKYYPPDFDPSKIPKKSRDRLNTMKVRMMLPFSLRCTSCGEYMYRGKKFNSKKEDVPEDTYLGIMVFRFYLNCIRCNALVSFKTDPRNSDYVCEHGASRNFEPWRAKQDEEQEAQEEQDAKEQVDAMNRLERVTKESKRELDILDALDEVKMMNAANNNISVDQILQNLKEQDEKADRTVDDKMLGADVAAAQAAFELAKTQVRRIEEPGSQSEEKEMQKEPPKPSASKVSATSVWGRNILKQKEDAVTAKPAAPPRRGLIGVKRKPEAPADEPPAKAPVGLGLGYSSSSSDDSPPRKSV